MGVVTDVTVKGLTTAVTNISNTGISDTTGQAIVTSINNLRSATSPIITDDTGQDIKTAINALANAISPAALNVTFNNTGTGLSASDVQAALAEVAKISAFDELVTITSIPTTETSYNLSEDYTKYKRLVIQFTHYNNVLSSLEVSTEYFKVTSAGARIMYTVFAENGTYLANIEIRKNTDTSVYVKSTSSPTNYRIKIYGCDKS